MNASLHAALKRHSVLVYFGLTFSISWLGALLVAAPHLLHHRPVPKMAGILMFPVMLLGPSFSGIFLTRLIDGSAGSRSLFSRMGRVRVPARWYAVLGIPPLLIFSVLICLKTFASPVFTPGRFLIGVLFGCPAGFFEEIGWMGFAFPKMSQNRNALSAGILLGLLWGLWHLPAIDFLGTSTPHGAYLIPYFVAFTTAMTAMRVIIAWIYSNTESVLLAQLMHASSTGALVIFSPPGVNAAQETQWYFAYACALWVIVAVITAIFGANLLSMRRKEIE
jgi:CAAX protease family protein